MTSHDRFALAVAATIAIGLAGCTSDGGSAAGTSDVAEAATVAGSTGGSVTGTDATLAADPDCAAPAAAAELPDGPLTDQADAAAPFPSVVVRALDDCVPVDTASWVGEPLVVNFWASWCGPCRAEMPDLAMAAREFDGRVRFVGVTFMDRPEDSLAFLEEIPVGYDTFIDANGQDLFRAIEARGTPATVLVDADGAVVFRHAGQISAADLATAISEHLGVDG